MEQGEERDILRELQNLAQRRSEVEEARLRAMEVSQESVAEALLEKLKAIAAAMSPGFERLYKEHHSGLQLLLRHMVRNPDHSRDIEQEGWKRFNEALPRFNLDMTALPLLRSCMRTAAIDYYRPLRNRELLPGDDHMREIVDSRSTPEVDAIRQRETEISSDVFLRLLGFAMDRSGGPVHERLTFGFNRLLESPPRVIVKTHSQFRLSEMTDNLRLSYIRESGLPSERVNSAFESLAIDLPRRLIEVDPVTANKYRGTRLPDIPVGAGRYGTYLPEAAEIAVSQWTDNVMRRLKKAARSSAGARNKPGGCA